MCMWFFRPTLLSSTMGTCLRSPSLLQLGALNISFGHDLFEMVVSYLSMIWGLGLSGLKTYTGTTSRGVALSPEADELTKVCVRMEKKSTERVLVSSNLKKEPARKPRGSSWKGRQMTRPVRAPGREAERELRAGESGLCVHSSGESTELTGRTDSGLVTGMLSMSLIRIFSIKS